MYFIDSKRENYAVAALSMKKKVLREYLKSEQYWNVQQDDIKWKRNYLSVIPRHLCFILWHDSEEKLGEILEKSYFCNIVYTNMLKNIKCGGILLAINLNVDLQLCPCFLFRPHSVLESGIPGPDSRLESRKTSKTMTKKREAFLRDPCGHFKRC